jgi:hypothetical protein
MHIVDYTSILSQLIYDCQMVVLAQVLAMARDDRDADIGAMIVDIRDQWLLDDTKGPVAELLKNRLFSMEEGPSRRFPVRFSSDGQTLDWANVTLHLSEFHRIIFEGIAEAQRIFDEELCLSSRSSPACGIPRLDLGLLVDDWDATAEGESFLTDPQNASYFDPLDDWLFRRVLESQVLFKTFWSQTATGTWVVCADAVQRYEDAVQRFLHALTVPFYIGSGQQGRLTDFLDLRWRNSTQLTRNLFLRDGQMLFILDNHKNWSISTLYRWPVRYLLPEVAQLVTQYLAIVQPFRQFLHREAPGFGAVSDYLWSRGLDHWEEDAMTRVVVDAGQRILGKHIPVQYWRQITKGIARKKLEDPEMFMLIEEDGEHDETDHATGSMAGAIHWQEAHKRRTMFRFYDGPMNYQGGLTDAEFDEFRRAGQLWHQLARDPLHFHLIPGARQPIRWF